MTFDISQAVPETFEGFVSQVFALQFGDQRVELLLDNVKLFSEATKRDSKVVVDGIELPPRRAFALTFEGPLDPELTPAIYDLTHAELGTFSVYITPFRRDQTCMLYESVFN